MSKLNDITEQIIVLKNARDILKQKYEQTDFHKKREKEPETAIPPSPEDENILKLLTAIQQLEQTIKQLQDEQFTLLKKQE